MLNSKESSPASRLFRIFTSGGSPHIVIDSSSPRNSWVRGRTVPSLVEGLSVSVSREAQSGWVHVTLNMRQHDVDVLSGSIVLSSDTWDSLVSDLPARSYGTCEAIRGRGLDFDSTLALARQPGSDRVTIALRPAPMPRASAHVQTVVDAETWTHLIEEIR